ncbi:MAG: hypothetical protein ACJ72E_13520 [Marmoricola sp.]
MVRVLRGVLVVLGVGTGAYGAHLLLDLGTDNLLATGRWLIGGVVLHDGILAPVTIAVALVATKVWHRVPAPLVVGAVVIGTVTAVAIPVLGKPGLRPDNPTLLDRNYALGWWGLVAVTAVAVVVAILRERRTSSRASADDEEPVPGGPGTG